VKRAPRKRGAHEASAALAAVQTMDPPRGGCFRRAGREPPHESSGRQRALAIAPGSKSGIYPVRTPATLTGATLTTLTLRKGVLYQVNGHAAPR
jgi:hypothetical protein